MPINYDLAKRESPRLKAELTRAQKKDYQAVLDAARRAVQRWEAWGAWPDDWARWQRAIVDAANQHTRHTGDYVVAPRLEDLVTRGPLHCDGRCCEHRTSEAHGSETVSQILG